LFTILTQMAFLVFTKLTKMTFYCLQNWQRWHA
jgi:hypothetical protein